MISAAILADSNLLSSENASGVPTPLAGRWRQSRRGVSPRGPARLTANVGGPYPKSKGGHVPGKGV